MSTKGVFQTVPYSLLEYRLNCRLYALLTMFHNVRIPTTLYEIIGDVSNIIKCSYWNWEPIWIMYLGLNK